MLFPRKRMQFTKTFQGKTEPEGWIVLDLKGADLEGATKLYLPVVELDALKAGGDTSANRLLQARSLLGGGEPEEVDGMEGVNDEE